MSTRDEEDAWRSIVENYGERARLDDEPDDPDGPAGDVTPSADTAEPSDSDSDADEAAGPRVVSPDFVPFEPAADLSDVDDEPAPPASVEERFVPETPPLPYVAPRRLLAWAVLVLAPLTLVVCGAIDLYLDPLVRTLLVAAGLGAFGYLVATMSNEPRDPWDDGARV